MINPHELFVGLRYLRAKRRTRFVSFITLISLLGIAPVATQIRLEKPKRRIRRIVRSQSRSIDWMGGSWDSFNVSPEDTTRILFNNEPVPPGYRVASDRWV